MKFILKIMNISRTNLTLVHLRVLVAIVDEGGFTAAAKRLGLTQSGVSQAIQTMEDALGAVLLARRRDRVEPTEIGGRVLVDARAALRSVERIHENCASWTGLDRGSLRLGSVVSAAAHVLPEALRLFRTRYPNIAVTLLEGSDAEVRDWTVGDAVDVGFTATLAPELEGEVIAEDDFLVVASSRHRRALGSTPSLKEVSRHAFIMSAAGCEPAIRALFANAACEPDVAFRVRDMAALLEMVRQGLGLTIVPALSLPKEKTGLCILELKPRQRRKLFLATRRQSPLSPAVEAFAETLRSSRQVARADRPRRP